MPRRIPTALLAIAAVMAAFAASAQAKVPRDFAGISAEDVSGGLPAYRNDGFARQRAAGIGLVRMNFEWSQIERKPGRYSFAPYDARVASAARHGIRILPVLLQAPNFRSTRPVRGAQRGMYPPRSGPAFGRFAAILARRYGPSGSYWRSHPRVPKVPIRSWQIWNEPSLPVYWRPRPSPRRYAAILKSVSRRLKKVDRRAEVVTAGVPPSKLRGSIRLTSFFKRLYKAGGRSGFDTLAVNAYATNNRELSRTVRSLRKVMRQGRDSRARLWITELGWSDAGPSSRFRVGADGQARKIKSALGWVGRYRKRYRLRGFVYFQWRDQRPYLPPYKDFWGLHTGLLNMQGDPKPALGTFAGAVHRMRRK